jgi:hypothetical protein
MPITIDEVVESAARGVLRALDARREGAEGLRVHDGTTDLVRSGFQVDFIIRAGGRLGDIVALNPQPLPPLVKGEARE